MKKVLGFGFLGILVGCIATALSSMLVLATGFQFHKYAVVFCNGAIVVLLTFAVQRRGGSDLMKMVSPWTLVGYMGGIMVGAGLCTHLWNTQFA